jgi:hypothetical protein
MTNAKQTTTLVSKKRWLSLDTWAVVLALAVAGFVRLGILPAVKW